MSNEVGPGQTQRKEHGEGEDAGRAIGRDALSRWQPVSRGTRRGLHVDSKPLVECCMSGWIGIWRNQHGSTVIIEDDAEGVIRVGRR
jgi:hypothetical protein